MHSCLPLVYTDTLVAVAKRGAYQNCTEFSLLTTFMPRVYLFLSDKEDKDE